MWKATNVEATLDSRLQPTSEPAVNAGITPTTWPCKLSSVQVGKVTAPAQLTAWTRSNNGFRSFVSPTLKPNTSWPPSAATPTETTMAWEGTRWLTRTLQECQPAPHLDVPDWLPFWRVRAAGT
jgi:hypothetical protein